MEKRCKRCGAIIEGTVGDICVVCLTQSPLSYQVGGNHYKDFAIQPVEFIHKNSLSFIEGCIVKYVCRWVKLKNKRDLEKAKHYIDILLEFEEENDEEELDEHYLKVGGTE